MFRIKKREKKIHFIAKKLFLQLFLLRKPLQSLKKNYQIFLSLYSPPVKGPSSLRWAIFRLPAFPHISETLRAQALLLTWTFHLFSAALLFILSNIFFVFF